MLKLPVIFRADTSAEFAGIVTAFFPTLPADYHGQQMTCYAHIGQHGGASFDYYASTRPATEAESVDLLAELKRIYEGGADPVQLQPCNRIAPAHRVAFNAEARRYREAVKGESLFVQGRIAESVQ
jgi:hypothetical protein